MIGYKDRHTVIHTNTTTTTTTENIHAVNAIPRTFKDTHSLDREEMNAHKTLTKSIPHKPWVYCVN